MYLALNNAKLVSDGFEMTCFIHVEVHHSLTNVSFFSHLTKVNFGILPSKIKDKKKLSRNISEVNTGKRIYHVFYHFSLPSVSCLCCQAVSGI